MHILRTKFKNGVIAEFLPPRRPSGKLIIVCKGMPGSPSNADLMKFLSRKGFGVILPRYRGSWESDGHFLRYSPADDVKYILDALPKGLTSLWDGKHYALRPSRIYIFASSFGGPAGLLLSQDRRVDKVIALSPVVDWTAPSKDEPLRRVCDFTKKAFGNAYRFSDADWNKLRTGRFYNPMHNLKKIDGKKIYIMHARDDRSVAWQPVKRFADRTGAKLDLFSRGGHLSSSFYLQPPAYRKIKRFLDQAS